MPLENRTRSLPSKEIKFNKKPHISTSPSFSLCIPSCLFSHFMHSLFYHQQEQRLRNDRHNLPDIKPAASAYGKCGQDGQIDEGEISENNQDVQYRCRCCIVPLEFIPPPCRPVPTYSQARSNAARSFWTVKLLGTLMIGQQAKCNVSATDTNICRARSR